MADLNPLQSVRLSNEIFAVSSLIQHGIRVIDNYREAEYDAEPAIVLLAGGAEKLLKLTYGLDGLDRTGTWPVVKGFGHRINVLDSEVRKLVDGRIDQHPSKIRLRETLDQVDSSYIKPVLETLTAYAQEGRYYNLEGLSPNGRKIESPIELWHELLIKIAKDTPGATQKIMVLDVEERLRITKMVGDSFCIWTQYIASFWKIGFFGAEARTWSVQLDLHKIHDKRK